MLFPFSTEPQTEWKRGEVVSFKKLLPKARTQVLSLFVPRAFYSSIIMTAGASFQMFVKNQTLYFPLVPFARRRPPIIQFDARGKARR